MKKNSLFCALKSSGGFTLIEMLVVLVIIGMLAGLVGPRMFGKVDDARVKTAKTQIKMLRSTLETMRLDINRFPTAAEGLDMLFHAPDDTKTAKRWRGPYLDEGVPVDPWDNPYQYTIPGRDGLPFALFSLGADGVEGGEGYDTDLGYLPDPDHYNLN